MLSLARTLHFLVPRCDRPTPKLDPGELMVKQAEKLVPLPPKLHRAAVRLMPWAYGTVCPLGFSLLVHRLGERSAARLIAAGAGLGVVVWAIGSLGCARDPAVDLTRTTSAHTGACVQSCATRRGQRE
jgi:hypothetical protein